MGMFIWEIAGIIMLAITIFVHKNTHEWDYDPQYDVRGCLISYGHIGDKLPFPRWLLFIMVFVYAIPIANVIAFLMGFIVYAINASGDKESYYNSPNIVFNCEPKWWKAFKAFMNEEV